MSNQSAQKRPRWSTAAIVGLLLVVIVVIVVAVTVGASAPPAARPSAAGRATSSATGPTESPTATATASPKASASARPTRSAVAKPTPQPTRTTSITQAAPAPIKKALSVEVTKMEAVAGTAQGPGEVAGPSVRFTIRITNSTGKAVQLSNTVVNAYIGADAAPAVQLQSPGARSFPTSVADGATATGAFVFNIPKAQRGHIQVTVDTSVNNPVIAFEGAAPRS